MFVVLFSPVCVVSTQSGFIATLLHEKTLIEITARTVSVYLCRTVRKLLSSLFTPKVTSSAILVVKEQKTKIKTIKHH